MKSRQWYADRGTSPILLSMLLHLKHSSGIPFRRGYLLYGVPGSGKTSIIHSLAGELGLDIYIISLSKTGLDDCALNALISSLPEHCIAIMEDIDAAFTHGLTRDRTDMKLEDLRHRDAMFSDAVVKVRRMILTATKNRATVTRMRLRTCKSRSLAFSMPLTAYRHRKVAYSLPRRIDTTHSTLRSSAQAAWTSISSSVSPAGIKQESCTSASTSRTRLTRSRRRRGI
jgi:hypothetical protein